MSFSNPCHTVLNRIRSKKNRRLRKASQKNHLNMENLEDRLVPASIMADFNNDGHGDMAITEFRDSVGELRILYGSNEGFRNQRILATGSQIDGFGFSLAKGDFNGDGFDDLAIGAPMANEESGAVHVYYGAPNGFQNPELWHQNISGLAGDGAQIGDVFGYSLASGNFNGDINTETGLAIDDLAIGIPGENNASGAVQVLYGSPSYLSTNGNYFLTQDSPGIKGSSEAGDQFGFSLAAGNFNGDSDPLTGRAIDDLAVGGVGERFDSFGSKLKQIAFSAGAIIGTVTNPYSSIYGALYGGIIGQGLVPNSVGFKPAPASGRVNILFGKTTGLDGHGSTDITRDLAGTGISLAAGNFDNDPYDDLVVGNIGNEDEMFGAIEVAYGTPENRFEFREGYSSFKQDNGQESLLGAPDQGDLFGVTISIGDTNNDGFDDLAVGDPMHANVKGAVNVVLGSRDGLSVRGQQFWSQEDGNVGDIAEEGDFFGADLVLGDINNDGNADLVVKVQDGPRGQALNVLYGSQNSMSVAGSETYNSVLGGYLKEDSRFFSFLLSNQVAYYESNSLQEKLDRLQEQHGFKPNPIGFQLNIWGFNEKWFFDRNDNHWAITPEGNLYQWNGITFQLGTLIERLAPSIYDNPNLLFQAGASFVSLPGSFGIEPIRLQQNDIYIEGSRDADVAHVFYDAKETGDIGDDEIVVILNRGGENLEKSFTPYQQIVDASGNSSYSRIIDRIIFEGKDGDDQFSNHTAWDSYALGGTGNDVLTGGSGNDVLVGGKGSDLLDGKAGNDHLRGDDWEYVESFGGRDILYGGSGNNLLEGDSGDDILYGGDENDTLLGGFGNDGLYGEGGYDRIEETGSKPVSARGHL